jgi:hypothetical protein
MATIGRNKAVVEVGEDKIWRTIWLDGMDGSAFDAAGRFQKSGGSIHKLVMELHQLRQKYSIDYKTV